MVNACGEYNLFWHDGVSVCRININASTFTKEEVLQIAESTVADYTAQKITKPQALDPLETYKFAETFTLTNIDTDSIPDFMLKTYTDLALDYSNSIYQVLTPVMDDNDPTTIETRYAPTWFPFTEEGHDVIAQTDTKNEANYYSQHFSWPQVEFSQRLKANFRDNDFCDMTALFEQVTINGHVANIGNYTYDGSPEHYSMFWSDGDYVFQISSYGLSEDDFIKVAESVKPIE